MPFLLKADINVPVSNGKTVEFKKGSHEKLPEVAVCYARTKGMLANGQEGQSIKNKDWFASNSGEKQ